MDATSPTWTQRPRGPRRPRRRAPVASPGGAPRHGRGAAGHRHRHRPDDAGAARGPGARVRDGSAAGPERGATALGSPARGAPGGVGRQPDGDRRRSAWGPGRGASRGCASASRPPRRSPGRWACRWSASRRSTRCAARPRRAPTTDPAAIAVVQAAGARDHYLALPGEAPRLVPPGTDLAAADRRPAHDRAGRGCGAPRRASAGRTGPIRWPRVPVHRMASASRCWSCSMSGWRPDRADDPATLVPVYVALPRGIAAGGGRRLDAGAPMRLRVEPMTVGGHPGCPRDRAAQLPRALAGLRLPPGAGDQPAGPLPGRPRGVARPSPTVASG